KGENIKPTPVPVPVPTTPATAMQLLVYSPTTQAQAPFSLGFVFPKGRVPNGSRAAASVSGAQVVVKNRWPDGSAKFAVVSGVSAVSAGTPLSVQLTSTTAVSVPPSTVTLAQLKATGVTAAVDAGSLGRATWSGTDWDAPFSTWVTGPAMSSWIYRK